MKHLAALVFAILVCEAAGAVGAVFTASAVGSWYTTLVRPEFAPPNWVFGPVWTTLYALMGIAAYLVWRHGWNRKNVRRALGVFAVQLALNAAWSPLFFGLHNPGAALIDIVLLWCAILATIVVFARISRTAACLLVPYLAWVTFATYLNYAIWTLN